MHTLFLALAWYAGRCCDTPGLLRRRAENILVAAPNDDLHQIFDAVDPQEQERAGARAKDAESVNDAEGRTNQDAQIVAPRAEAATEETSDIERLRRVLDGVTVQLLALIDGPGSRVGAGAI